MPATLEQLTDEALTLPDKSRAALAQRLLDSLPPSEVAPVGDGYFLSGAQLAEIRRGTVGGPASEWLSEEEFFARLGRKGG